MKAHSSKTWLVINQKIQKCLTAVGIFCGGMKNEHLSSVEKKVTELPTAEDLAATCMTSSKQNMTSHHSIKFKSAWQLSGFFVEGRGTNISHLSRKKSPNCLQLKTWLPPAWPRSNETWLVINQKIQKCSTAVGFSWEGWRTTTSHLSRKSHRVAYS